MQGPSGVTDSPLSFFSPSGIPKILHQIWWQGEQGIPADYRPYQASLKQLHPSCRYVLWDEQTITQLVRSLSLTFFDIWNELPYVIQKIDSAKVFILLQYGGAYVDFDMEPIRSVEPLLLDHPLVFSRCYVSGFSNFFAKLFGLKHFAQTQINNGFIASVPRHPVLCHAVELFHFSAQCKPHAIFQVYIAQSCGTEVLAHALSDIICQVPDLDYVAFPPEYFEPRIKARGRQPLVTRDTRVIHHSYREWANKKVQKKDIVIFLLFSATIISLCIVCLACMKVIRNALDRLATTHMDDHDDDDDKKVN